MQLKLKESNILRVDIQDYEGNPTGEHLEFDIQDVELPLKYQRLLEEDKTNRNWLRTKLLAIDKRQDIKGKKLFSKNEEDKLHVLNEFYDKEMKTIDLFLGENGCKKLLNGRKPYLEMFDDIMEMIDPVLDELEKEIGNIESRIKNKYSKYMKEDNILE